MINRSNAIDGGFATYIFGYFTTITVADVTAWLNLALVAVGLVIGYYRWRINRREWREKKKESK